MCQCKQSVNVTYTMGGLIRKKERLGFESLLNSSFYLFIGSGYCHHTTHPQQPQTVDDTPYHESQGERES